MHHALNHAADPADDDEEKYPFGLTKEETIWLFEHRWDTPGFKEKMTCAYEKGALDALKTEFLNQTDPKKADMLKKAIMMWMGNPPHPRIPRKLS